MSPATKQARNLPDQIVDLFIALIFIGDLKPGDRLPAELKLTKILQVNQSSLRMAMRVLTRMNVIESTRGSGLVVQDYKEQAELNFMTELVRIPELELGSNFLIEMLDSATAMLFSQLMYQTSSHGSSHTTRYYLPALEQQITFIEENRNPGELAELDMILQHHGAQALTNPIIRAMFNSIAPLRRHLMEIFYSMDGDHQLSQIKKQRDNALRFASNNIDVDTFNARYLELVNQQMDTLRKHLASHPTQPHLRQSPLQHFPEMISLFDAD